jgi:3-oxoacyl-[acyl-carrier protein] reductase
MLIDFTNKTALITGATRGIGKSVADCFYGAGANLILTGTKQEEVEKLNAENKKNGIRNIEYIQADFSDPESTGKFLSKLDQFERIDICVNNAGVNKIADFTDTTIEDFNWINEINVNVPYKILKIVGPKMITNGYGRVVNVASIWSVITRPGRSMYTSSKNALVGLTKTLAIEWASHNVLVNAVSPGFTLTELTKSTNTLEQLEAIEKMIPAKRMAEPDEIARVIAFLCSELNTYLTGQNITIDGGYTNV